MQPEPPARPPRPRTALVVLLFAGSVLGTLALVWVLVVMFSRKQEARNPFLRVVELNELHTDPAIWAQNWPDHYDDYVATAGDRFYGGSSALTASKLEAQPWLRRLYAGYAFSIDYREARGHAYMLYDQGVTERITKKPQAGACLHCHASTNVLYRRIGREALGRPADEESLATEFDLPAMLRGFEELSRRPYSEVLALLQQTPDGTPGAQSTFPQPPAGGFTGEFAGEPVPADHPSIGNAHPVSCIDCHDPTTLRLRVTRPGFVRGIAALAAGDGEAPHLPSIERWRRGDRETPYDPNRDATRQEMRSFVCGQCHVEYYCGDKLTLTFPWSHGLRMEDEERHWDELTFEDGTPFYDYAHGETRAPVLKVQHPEFELWSNGIHARSGVSCVDCHMPYERRGAMKMSSHDVRSPLQSIDKSCRTCHHSTEGELAARIGTIQQRTVALTERAAAAMTDMLDAILDARAAGAKPEDLAEIHQLQRKAMWRLDYISSENSRGFHADQESARILGESIDYSRRAQAAALRLRTTGDPDTSDLPREPVFGVTDRSDER